MFDTAAGPVVPSSDRSYIPRVPRDLGYPSSLSVAQDMRSLGPVPRFLGDPPIPVEGGKFSRRNRTATTPGHGRSNDTFSHVGRATLLISHV